MYNPLNNIAPSHSSSVLQINLQDMHRIITEELPFEYKDVGKAIKRPNSKKTGFSSVYINQLNNNSEGTIGSIHSHIQTLHDFFELSTNLYPQNDCLGERLFDYKLGKYEDKFTFQNFQTIKQRKINVGSGLLNFLQKNEFKTDKHSIRDFIVTMYSGNRLEWLLTDLACQSYSITNTSLYDTLGPETSKYILELTQSPIVICSKDKLDKLLQIKKNHNLPFFIGVVSMDDIDELKIYSKFHEVGLELIDFKTLERIGMKQPLRIRPPTPDTLYTLSFTSGTTGVPKGVMLNHATLVAGISFALINVKRFKSKGQLHSLSFLPLAHIFERQMSMFSLTKGIGVGFPPASDVDSLIENLKLLKPNYLTAVPRVYSRIEGIIKSYHAEKKTHSQKELRLLLGMEKMEFVLTASAPINPRTMEFISQNLGVGFLQLYGCTETYGALTTSSGYEFFGSSGPVGCTCEIKLKGVPELNYHVEDDNNNELTSIGGELLMRGAQIFQGYYKNEKLTLDLLDSEGWYHTGDIARVDKDGKLYIVDRVKNFFKLQQGEYVIPEKIENVYLSSNPILTQLYVHGDSNKNYLIGVAGVNLKYVKDLIESKKHLHDHKVDELIKHDDVDLIAVLNKSPKLKKLILDEINNEIVHQNLQGFEKLHNIFVDLEPLKLSDELITPTMKLRRNNCRVLFKDTLSDLYNEGSLISKNKL